MGSKQQAREGISALKDASESADAGVFTGIAAPPKPPDESIADDDEIPKPNFLEQSAYEKMAEESRKARHAFWGKYHVEIGQRKNDIDNRRLVAKIERGRIVSNVVLVCSPLAVLISPPRVYSVGAAPTL